MQKFQFKQKLTHKLSPQQIQLFKLLKIPTVELDNFIQKQLEQNPVLEKQDNENIAIEEESTWENSRSSEIDKKKFDIYKIGTTQRKDYPIEDTSYSLQQHLLDQLSFLTLSKTEQQIAEHIIGCLDEDGYLRIDLYAIIDDLAFTQYLIADINEIKHILNILQEFEPIGVFAQNLQSCLLMQISKKNIKDPIVELAYAIVAHQFDAFSSRHYDKIFKKLNSVQRDHFSKAILLIEKLNPQPGNIFKNSYNQQVLYPDFIIKKNNEGQLDLFLNDYTMPTLGIKKYYTDMLTTYYNYKRKNQEIKKTIEFLKQQHSTALWLIEAMKQRQHTLLCTMQAILKLQYTFFIDGLEENLIPMTLKDIAQEVDMDISTISRAISQKSVQTHTGIYPLKFFFSENIKDIQGEKTNVSNKVIKFNLQKIIIEENKKKPYSDEAISMLLKNQGYTVARRTVTKYREQLGIPVARLRKKYS